MTLLGNTAGRPDGTISGITTGIVKENWDEKHPGMVRVEMFLGEAGKSVTGWVRVMTGYAGNGYGNYVLPEVGQRVVLGFEMGQKDRPVVLGALWDQKNSLPPETALEKNTVKRFRTKGGCEVVFDEEQGKEKIEVFTPAKLGVHMEDEKKLIRLTDDQGENMLTLDCEQGVLSVCAKKKIELKIGQDAVVTIDEQSVSIKSKDIKTEAQNGFSAQAQNVKLSAQAGLTAEGTSNVEIKASGSLKVNASGMLEIKGSMVKIN